MNIKETMCWEIQLANSVDIMLLRDTNSTYISSNIVIVIRIFTIFGYGSYKVRGKKKRRAGRDCTLPLPISE